MFLITDQKVSILQVWNKFTEPVRVILPGKIWLTMYTLRLTYLQEIGRKNVVIDTPYNPFTLESTAAHLCVEIPHKNVLIAVVIHSSLCICLLLVSALTIHVRRNEHRYNNINNASSTVYFLFFRCTRTNRLVAGYSMMY